MVGGSLVFSTTSSFLPAIMAYAAWRGIPTDQAFYIQANELPPMNLSIVTVDDEGYAAQKLIKSMVIVDDAGSIEVDRPIMTESYSFMAAEVSNWVPFVPGDNSNVTSFTGPFENAKMGGDK